LGRVPDTYAIALVSDCNSCSTVSLKLPKHSKLPRILLTPDASAVAALAKQWPGERIVCDANHEVLREAAYDVAPQLFLINKGKVVAAAVGAIDCESQWRYWTR
jgi:hypothetical protein